MTEEDGGSVNATWSTQPRADDLEAGQLLDEPRKHIQEENCSVLDGSFQLTTTAQLPLIACERKMF